MFLSLLQFALYPPSVTSDIVCFCLFMFQGYSRSETWYAYLDFGTNYCNLHNLITGLLFLFCPSYSMICINIKFFSADVFIVLFFI